METRTARAPRPLAGRTVVVTRAAAQAPRFVALLEAAGASVVEAPTIAIEPPASWAPLDAALDRLAEFRWVIFTSVNGVDMVGRRLAERGGDWRGIAGKRVAAIGPATAEALTERGVRAEAVPGEYRAEGLVERLRAEIAAGDAVLLPRAARTRDVLVRELAALGARVVEVPAYETRRVTDAGQRVRAALAAGTVDVLTFTSSSTVRHFAELFGEDERGRWFPGLTVASIGPITAATAAEYGLRTTIMPADYTIPALARAIEEHFERSR
ncbi:MAG: uroporphyrinogen-III synthase [Candidatus Rokubacteria bacterium]|nr:uroporphyrinogen-III synthase [Candidatus Rokubacteria bacterium]